MNWTWTTSPQLYIAALALVLGLVSLLLHLGALLYIHHVTHSRPLTRTGSRQDLLEKLTRYRENSTGIVTIILTFYLRSESGPLKKNTPPSERKLDCSHSEKGSDTND